MRVGEQFVDPEITDLLNITQRVGPGYYYLDRTEDADAIRRVQAYQCMPPGGSA